jgi:putative membrane-bound dehydrogenase-like protein
MKCLLFAAGVALGAPQEDRPAEPLSPAQALKTFRLAAGFRIELFAAEPDVRDPVAMAFDEDGRAWVVEMADYPLGPPSGRLRVLEDTDGDGRADRSTLVASGLSFPTGVLPWRGGVLVTAAPEILFLKDEDGDGKADRREVVFTGFVEGNPQHRVNGLQFGIDGWVYGANGDSGGRVRRVAGADEKPVSIRGADFRFRPDYSGLEPVSGQSQFANTFDDWGHRFINNNPNHIRHPVLPMSYLTDNPRFSPGSLESSPSDHGQRVFPISRLEPRFNDPHTAGHFTSACSVTIYRGTAFPPEFRGNAFTCEPVHNLVHRDILVPSGVTFVARRGEENGEFLASTDNWFRPVNLCAGPDGALYVVDMYRAVVEHPQWIPLEIQRKINLRAGEDRGRIYRIVHESSRPSARPRLGGAPAAELVALLEHPDAWWRTTAQRLLVERRDPACAEPLRALARGSKVALARVHALWTRAALGVLGAGEVAAALGDPDPGVREHALRMSEVFLSSSAELRDRVFALAEDPSLRVRFQLALTLGRMRGEARVPAALARLAARDLEDRWVRAAVLCSTGAAAPGVLAHLRAAALDRLEASAPGAVELVRGLADLVAAGRDEGEAVRWLREVAAGEPPAPAPWRIAGLGVLTRPGVNARALLATSGAAALVGRWGARALETALDGAREPRERVDAVELVASLEPTPEAAARLETLLRPQEPPEVQVAVVRALSSWPGDPAGARLLEGWAERAGRVRREILNAMFATPGRLERLLERLERGEVRPAELEPHHRDRLLKHASAAVRERARKALESAASPDRQELVREMSAKVMALKGDPVSGERVYVRNCATCHRWHGQGVRVGPDLTAVSGRDTEALLTDILDPNRAVDPAYQTYVIRTSKEEFSGVLASETPAAVTLVRAGGEQATVLRRDIVAIKAWPASLMPEGIEANVSPQDLADLLEFLRRGGGK